MACIKNLSEDIILTILYYLNYNDLFYNNKSIISKSFYNNTQKLLKIDKTTNIVSNIFLSLYWEKKDMEQIPIILYCPNRFGQSFSSRLFKIFDKRQQHQRLFVSNVFTKSLSFMIKLETNIILFVEFLENRLNYNVYTRCNHTNQILY